MDKERAKAGSEGKDNKEKDSKEKDSKDKDSLLIFSEIDKLKYLYDNLLKIVNSLKNQKQ